MQGVWDSQDLIRENSQLEQLNLNRLGKPAGYKTKLPRMHDIHLWWQTKLFFILLFLGCVWKLLIVVTQKLQTQTSQKVWGFYNSLLASMTFSGDLGVWPFHSDCITAPNIWWSCLLIVFSRSEREGSMVVKSAGFPHSKSVASQLGGFEQVTRPLYASRSLSAKCEKYFLPHKVALRIKWMNGYDS